MYQNAAAPEAARLEDYLRAVQRHKWAVIALTLVGFALAFAYVRSSTDTYTATASVKVNPSPRGSIDSRLVKPNLETEREVLASNATAQRVITDLGLADTAPTALLRKLKIEFRPDSQVLQVSYTSTDRVGAASAADAFATNYVDAREESARSFYDLTITDASTRQAAVRDEIGAIQTEIDKWQDARRTASANGESDEVAVIDGTLSGLRTDLSSLNTENRNLVSAIRNAESVLATRDPAAEVLRSAIPPTTPDGLPRTAILIAGLILGGIVGFVTAFLLERLDTTARDSEDVGLALNTNVMGAIPTLGFGHRAGPGSLIMLTTGGSARISAAREAFRRLRSSIQFLNSSSGVSSIIVTSASPAEGKSLTSSNLAIALAQNGSRCVLVSADLRRPTLEKLFNIQGPRPGLAEYLGATAELNAEKVPNIENLWLIRSGMTPSNPGELLNSDRFQQMVKELEREGVEYVVIDTPPVLSTADAVSAARYVDGVIVVVDTERTETADLLQVRADLERSGSRLIGAVMNRQRFERAGLFKRDKYSYYTSNQ